MEAFTDGTVSPRGGGGLLQTEGPVQETQEDMGLDSGAQTPHRAIRNTPRNPGCVRSRCLPAAGNPRVGCLLKAVHCSNACDCVNLETIKYPSGNTQGTRARPGSGL